MATEVTAAVYVSTETSLFEVIGLYHRGSCSAVARAVFTTPTT